MKENLLRRIESQLNAKFYTMNDTWLRDCVEFFIRDKIPREITDKHIFEFVESQWQLSNLREISNENGCLPKNLAQHICTTLTGTYILQVDKMYDITSSKYKQLCKIRKINNDNLEVIGKEESVGWEPKARRMMQLCLTDGVQDVTAIEYVPLKHMASTLLPGYKVMIIGPVNCRRGVILLENGRYREIGGEVESLLKPNALENVLARTLDEPENPDPYYDNGSSYKEQNVLPDPANEDYFFNDDFEQAVDLEAVTAVERQSQEIIEIVQDRFVSMKDRRQTNDNEMQQTTEEFLEDVNFESLETRSSDLPIKALRVFPASQMEIERFEEEDDIMIIEEASTSRDFRDRLPPLSTRYIKNENIVELPDNNFDHVGSEIIAKGEESQSQQQQGGDSVKMRSKIQVHSPPLMIKPSLANLPVKVENNLATQNGKFMANTSDIIPQVLKTKTTNFPLLPLCPSKICDTLNDVLRENIVGTTYRTVRGQVKSYSALTKRGKCWTVKALIADHTSSVDVCFDSKILERFLGFTVQEFSQKKKLAKSDPRINNELRLNLREAQRRIENLDALLKLELVKDQVPKIVDITQVTS